MSAGEYRDYKKFLADNASTMPGRLGVKDSLHVIYSYLVGAHGQVQSTIFQLAEPSLGVLLVDSIRMDVSNQSIFADAAFVLCHTDADTTSLAAILEAGRDYIVCIKMEKDEIAFWRHLLPGFSERCRQWQHKPTCEYKVAGCMPISTDPGKRYMCTCGDGIFPANYLKDLKQRKDVFKHAVRVAIPVMFASPINTDDAGSFPTPSPPPQPATPQGQAPVQKPEPPLVDLGAKRETCFECGAKSSKDGAALLKCARCKFAQYCSPECQRQDWKKGHRQLCPQLKED